MPEIKINAADLEHIHREAKRLHRMLALIEGMQSDRNVASKATIIAQDIADTCQRVASQNDLHFT